MFDILLQSAPDLSDSDRAKVKQSARELVERIKELLVLNWQQKLMPGPSSRSSLKKPSTSACLVPTHPSCTSRSVRRCSPTSSRPTPSATGASTPDQHPGSALKLCQPQG